MGLKEVLERIEKIRFEAQDEQDDEVAHIQEDELLYDFVYAIRDGKYNSLEEVQLIATEITKVSDIKFSRWYA
jgi:hypothetical protein